MSTLKSIKRTNSPQWSFVYLSQFMSELMVPLVFNGLRLRKSSWHGENCLFLPLILSGSFYSGQGEALQASTREATCNQDLVSQRENVSFMLKPCNGQEMRLSAETMECVGACQ